MSFATPTTTTTINTCIAQNACPLVSVEIVLLDFDGAL